MSPQAGDGPTSPDSSRPSGLANVFRGLTTSRSSRSLPLTSSSSSVALPVADIVNATPTTSVRLSPHTMDSFEMLKSGSLNDRISAANTLKFSISEYPLNPVLDIWYAGKDLIDLSKPAAARTAGWELLTECVKHASSTDLERQEYFQTLAAPANPEDFHLQLAALVDLTQNGRNLDGFDYELLPLLNLWLREGYKAVRVARKNASAARSARNARSRVVVSGEEKNFAQLVAFLRDVLKFSFRISDDKAIAGLIDVLLEICISTSVEDDIRASINVMDTVLTFGSIPRDKLKACIQVLSSIYCLVAGLAKEAWRTLSNICRSHNGQKAVRLLLEVLRTLSVDSLKDKDMSREIRGSLAVLQKLLSKNGTKGYPVVPYPWLIDGLSATVKASPTSRIRSAVLSVVNSLFHDSHGGLHPSLTEEDWSVILGIAAECCVERRPKDDQADDPVAKELLLLIGHLESLLNQPTIDFVPRHAVIRFFAQTHSLLPDTAAVAVLDYFQEFRSCSPSDSQWENNLRLVLSGFFANRERSSETRLRAFRVIMDAYELIELVGVEAQQDSIPGLVKSALQNIAEETDVAVLDAVVTLVVSIAASCDLELFDFIITAMRGAIENDRLKAPVTAGLLASPVLPLTADDAPPAPEQSPSNVITKGYVKMFIQAMNSSSEKSVKLFNALLQIAKFSHGEVDARLTAMKLLFRLRADWANRIFLSKELETNFLASIIGRTDSSIAAKRMEDVSHGLRLSHSEHGGLSRPARGISFSQGQPLDKGLPVRSASGARPSVAATYRNLWKLPDPDALPADVPVLISPLLVSHESDESDETEGDEASEASEEGSKPVQAALDIASWLETVLGLLGSSEWEVYSFVLVHLPSQLSNHGIFTNAIPQIEEVRKLICEQIRTNKFQEPPNASGLRRADVAICLFNSLTMILSYHEHFQKGEEDEIVRTFVHGIGAWERTAQCCIHALSICCHELPLSATKSLGQMLNSMAAIITQPNVAIHILEFLASLSRLQNVYVNFREDEYRTVFGICFRYLDYARDKRQQANRGHFNSEPPTPLTSTAAAHYPGSGAEAARPSASDDLPEYVYALAYHVILFWFLALKLPDRATHVGTIIKRLCVDPDGSGNISDELAVTTIDFMRRATYADVDESTEDPLFTQERFGEMVGRHWILGSSIVTVKQSANTGWAQVTKRQASGTSVYMVRESLQPPPLHQVDYNDDAGGEQQSGTILPSHLLIQLLASVPQVHDRPIPLPTDDAIDRTLRVFDRIPTVDGHKVGVIYIGEGQTDEREILGNVSGSSDYVEFLNGLGTLTKLKGAKFNTQGLDREYDVDGQYTFCWRDRLTEMVFHVTTQMPTDFERDPQMANKKRHIGNDFVNIIFNDSGLPFKFDTFPSQFNYVNIVITPASRASFTATREAQQEPEAKHRQPFYRVQVMSKPGFPDISPAFETKMVSLKALPGFIRLVALNASVFSLVWQSRTGGEHVSSWRGRLREIKKLRERYGPRLVSSGQQQQHPHGPSPSPPPMSSGSGSVGAGGGGLSLSSHQGLQHQQQPQQTGQHQAEAATPGGGRPSSSVRDSFNSLRRTSVATFFTSTSEQTSHRSSVLSGSVGTNDTEVGGGGSSNTQGSDALVDSVNFSKWA